MRLEGLRFAGQPAGDGFLERVGRDTTCASVEDALAEFRFELLRVLAGSNSAAKPPAGML